MIRDSDAQRIVNNMRRALPPPQVKLTKRRAEDMIVELLEACRTHSDLMFPYGRTSENFWSAVMDHVLWTRGLSMMVVEEFALALAEAARLALSPEHYALVTSGAPTVALDFPDYFPISWAALRFLVAVKTYKAHLDHRGDESVRALRGIEITESGIRSQPLRLFPASRGRLA